MAYNEALAGRVRKLLAKHRSSDEIKMFGGLCFTLRGHMCCGIHKNDLMIRVGSERQREALTEPHARPMDITGRPLKGFVFVGPGGYRTDKALVKWIERGVDFTSSLPPK
jgi:hypothetical protein